MCIIPNNNIDIIIPVLQLTYFYMAMYIYVCVCLILPRMCICIMTLVGIYFIYSLTLEKGIIYLRCLGGAAGAQLM